MNLLTYTLTLCASFSGLIFGVILSNVAIEEITIASKYLKYLNVLLVSAIVFTAIYKIYLVYAIILTLVTAASFLIFRNRNNATWIYSGMGVLFYIAMVSNELLNVSILIFVYGMSISTLYATDAYNKKKSHMMKPKDNITLMKNILLRHSLFLAAGIIFYLIFTTIRNI